MTPGERRKNARLGLAIPVRVQGYLADGSTWEEFTTTDDVSLGGSCFPLARDVELGQILFIGLALPKRLRQYDLYDSSYRVYTLVRSVRRRPDQNRIGVMFFGKYPPRGFHERPSARYLLPTDSKDDTAQAATPPEASPEAPPPSPPGPAPQAAAPPEAPPSPASEAPSPAQMEPAPEPPEAAFPTPPGLEPPPQRFEKPIPPEPTPETPRPVTWGRDPQPEPRPGVPPPPAPAAPAVEFHPSREVPQDRRDHPRMQLFVNFTIQQVDEWGAVLQEELTVADNVSQGGARMMTTLGFQVSDVILVQEAGGGFATRAEVRGVTRVQPTVERLHLKFLDRQAPERLLRQ